MVDIIFKAGHMVAAGISAVSFRIEIDSHTCVHGRYPLPMIRPHDSAVLLRPSFSIVFVEDRLSNPFTIENAYPITHVPS